MCPEMKEHKMMALCVRVLCESKIIQMKYGLLENQIACKQSAVSMYIFI